MTFNQINYTKLCLYSLKKYTKQPYELIIVDNGSSDGTTQYLKSIVSDKLIINKTNLGFSRGVNQGIKIANGDCILLLNNDTIVANNWLSNQLKCLKSSPNIGIVGPRSNYAGGEQGGIIGDFSNINKIIEFSKKFNKPDSQKWFNTYVIVGFCMLIKRELIKKIGLFDESYKIGIVEDSDFCERALRQGYRLFCAGDTFIYHYGSRTFKGNNFDINHIFNENVKRFKKKWNKQ